MPPDSRAAAPVPPASAAETLAAEFRAVHRAEPLDAHGPPATSEATLRVAQFEAGATALCLSGGGIRSASFCLGVVQGLARRGLLARFDYLSTVSGGGYIGGWFSANCKRAVERRTAASAATPPRAPEPHWWEQDADWGRSIEHLRKYSNYLSPQVGFFSADTWSMFTVWIRNALLVQWTVIMAVASILLVPRVLPKFFVGWYGYHHWRWLGVTAFVLAVVGIAGNQQRVSRGKPAWIMSADHWLYALAVFVLCLVTGVGYAVATRFDPFGGSVVPLGSALFEAAVVVFGGYALLLVGVAIYGYFTEGEAVALNYTQTHVQWLIVVPLLATGF